MLFSFRLVYAPVYNLIDRSYNIKLSSLISPRSLFGFHVRFISVQRTTKYLRIQQHGFTDYENEYFLIFI